MQPRARMPSLTAVTPVAQHRGRDPQLIGNLHQRPTAARQQCYRLRLELIRKPTPFLTHSTASRSPRSLAKVSTDSGEAHFVSMELSRRAWLITSLSPGAGEKMSKHAVPASDVPG